MGLLPAQPDRGRVPDAEGHASAIANAVLPRSFTAAVIVYAGILLVGVVFGLFLQATPAAQRGPGPSSNIFTFLFAVHEPVVCAVHLLGLGMMYRWLQLGAPVPKELTGDRFRVRRPVLTMALFSVIIAAAGTFMVFHAYPFSMDEYMADFQATIFATGKVSAPVPEQWREFLPWLKPIFVVYDKEAHTWTSPYLPVYGALRALPMLGGVEWLLNPVLAGLSILAIAKVCTQLWPEEPSRSILAAALLFTSTQFLITSMTAYAMPAHLCFNLLWLCLFTRPGSAGKMLAPWLGLLAVGLHQPNVHLLFALPFGLRFIRQRQWHWAAYYLVMYCLALAVWRQWWAVFRPGAMDQSAGLFTWPQAEQLGIQLMNIVLVASWQSALLGILVIVAIRHWKTLPVVTQDLAIGCVITFAAYLLFNSDQGHGWGYRYFYAVLGNLVLLAVAGWSKFEALATPRLAGRFAVCSCAVALLLLLPLRASQAEAVVRPFADANAAIHSAQADVVMVPIFQAWYAQDLVRNDPFLEHSPKVMRSFRIDQARFRLLQECSSVRGITPEALAGMGLITDPSAP